MIAVNYTFDVPIPYDANSITGAISASWYLDVGAIQNRLSSLGYNASVTRIFTEPPKVRITIIGVPDFFARTLNGNQDFYYLQAKTDAETSTELAASGQLNATNYATPATYVQNAVTPYVNNTVNTVSDYVPTANQAATLLGLSTPVIVVGSILLLVLLVKK